MNVSLAGKTALIGGSTQGIGLAIARSFAEAGAVCLLLARNEATLKEIVADLPAVPGSAHQYAVADFSDTTQVRQACQSLLQDRVIDIVVNNTGGPAAGPLMDASPETFLQAFQQHIINSQEIAQLVLPGMKKNGYGRFINIVSTSVRIPIPNLGVSNTIRGAMASWAKTLSNEAGRYNITVNNILPGLTKTKRLESLIDSTAASRKTDRIVIEKEMIESIPMKRFAEPEEIAYVAAFLASPAASYINGASIPVDGGRTGSI